MNKYRILFTVSILILTINLCGCSSMFSHIFGNDHLKDKKYKFLFFDNDKSSVLYGGYLEINKVENNIFSGEFKIIDVFSESIPIASGIVEGKEYDDRDKASMTFKGKLSEDKIIITLDKTWNLLEGIWSYKSYSGKFVAFDNN
jgi:hypothetical protein